MPETVAGALRRAAPVYRAHDWIADDRGNPFSIAIATTKHWRGYLDGKIARDEALRRILTASK